jgi:hypothetical protein
MTWTSKMLSSMCHLKAERVIKLLQDAHAGRQVYAIQNDGSRMERNIGRGYLESKGWFEGRLAADLAPVKCLT